MEIIADLLGAALGTWVIYNIFNIILFYFLDKKIIPFVAFIGSFILILVVTTFTVGFIRGFVIYIPVLFLWFIVDLVKTNKKKVEIINDSHHSD